MFILSAFRDSSVGTDTLTYELIFERIESGQLSIPQELGWYYLNKVVVMTGGDFQSLLVISTLCTLLPIFYIVKKYSLNPMLSIFLYYAFYIYLQSFNIIRQTLAISLFLLFLPFLFKGKNKYYILGVILASLFHTTALLTLPLVFVRKIPYSKVWWCFIVFISLVFGVILSSILLPKIASLLGYGHYLYLSDNESETGIFLLLTNLFAVFLILTSSKESLLLKLFFAYIIFYNITLGVPYAYRLILFFSIIQILFLPYYVNNNKLIHKKLALLLVIGYATMFFIRTYGGAGIIPYKSVY